MFNDKKLAKSSSTSKKILDVIVYFYNYKKIFKKGLNIILENNVSKKIDKNEIVVELIKRFDLSNMVDLSHKNLIKDTKDNELEYWGSLKRVHLEGADLTGACMEKMDLRGIYLNKAVLSKTKLGEADLRLSHLEGADLREVYLENANLT